jgi:single-strand DNA-binding protein
MSSFNRIIMAGNLTRDPDYKQLTSGQSVCRLGLASNRQFKNRQSGDMIQEVCYIDIDVWGPQAESCRQYLQKGRPILVEGRLKLDTWDDANGQKRSKHSIVADRVVFLGSNAQSEASTSAEDEQRLDPNNPKEQELMSQLDQIRNRVAARPAVKGDSLSFEAAKPVLSKVEGPVLSKVEGQAAASAKKRSSAAKPVLSRAEGPAQSDVGGVESPSTGEIDFADQPPFADDLPF